MVRTNDAGDRYLDAKISRGEQAVTIVVQARAECARRGAVSGD